MTQWEYLTLDRTDALRTISEQGKDGWELVGEVKHKAVFKRQKRKPPKEYARIKMDIELICKMAEQGWEVVGIFQEEYEEGPLYREHPAGGCMYRDRDGMSGNIKNYVLLERE